MKESFFEAASVPLLDALGVGSLAVVVAVVLLVFRDRRLRMRSLTGVVAGTGWLLVIAMIKGNSARHVLVLFADTMLGLAVVMLCLWKELRAFDLAAVRGEPEPEPEPETAARKGRLVAFAVTGLITLLLALEYLPIWPA